MPRLTITRSVTILFDLIPSDAADYELGESLLVELSSVSKYLKLSATVDFLGITNPIV